MIAFRPSIILSSAALFLLSHTDGSAQCTNTSPYPPSAITPNGSGAVTTIDPCNWQIEYSTIIGIVAGESYEFAYEGGAWITVHQGTFDGPVIGYGPSPLTVEAIGAGNLYPHWNTDSLCGTAQDCHTSSVQLLGAGCDPPEAGVDVIMDCENAQFNVGVAIVSLGDASSVGLSWAVNGGSPSTLSGLQVGVYQLGPFTNGSLVDLTVVHAQQPACNVQVNDLTNEPCATQSCGPDTYTFCYGNNENYVQSYQGTSTYPLQLQFNSGNVSGSGNDALVIHDGLLPTDPVLFSGVGNAGNLTGVTVVSTNPDHALTLTFTSNGSFSCVDAGGSLLPWNYTVACLDCEQPAGEAGNVVTDCAEQQFSVSVTVTDLGSADTLEITNSVGAPAVVVTEPGTYTAGPFPVGTPVQLTLVNTESVICNVPLGTFENEFCPLLITCGGPALEQTYCYTDSDAHSWLYQNTGTESLAILFSSGSIESATYDHLTIHDGDDQTAPILYDHVINATEQLANLLVISTGPALYMTMSSDNSVSCASASQAEWNWTVGCLDCEQPEASYDVVLDCENSQFSIVAQISELGSDPTVTITNTGGAPVVEVTEAGTYSVGPFPLGAEVQVNLVVENALCGIHSPVLTSAPCPLIGCGPYQFDLCYPNNMDTTIVYQSPGTYPISLLFNSGTIDTFGDFIEVYDGLNYLAPLVYTGSNGGDLTGLQFTSTNPDNALCVRFFSNAFTSCAGTGGETPWNWSVSCLDCTNPAATFELVADCLHHGFDVAVNVSSLGSAADLRITDSWSQDTVSNIGLGTTFIGTIPVGETAHITVLNGSNPLCRINSEEFTLPPDECVVTACETIGVEYCYVDADTAWFVYQSGQNTPVTISFAYGQLLEGDEVWLYNGLDQTAQLVFAGDVGGDLAGLALSSSNPDNALTLQVISDGAGSCGTGDVTLPMYWTVGCGLVGQVEEEAAEFSLFPQPCTDVLNIGWSASSDEMIAMELFDIAGRGVMRGTVRPSTGGVYLVNVGHLPPGGYTLRASTSSGVFSSPVLIQR